MRAILISLLISVVKRMVGAANWAEILGAVTDAMVDPDLSGSERKDIVVAQLKGAVKDMGASLMNLAIEAAVQKVKG